MLWVLVPSWRLLGLACSTALVLQFAPVLAFTPTWAWSRSLLAILPPGAHVILCLLVATLRRCVAASAAPIPPHVVLAALAVAVTSLELSMIDWWSSTAACLLFHKYLALRFLLEVADTVAVHRPGGCLLSICHDACRDWAHSWRFLRDFLLGMVLSSGCMAMALVPGFAKVHALFLFRVLPQTGTANCGDASIDSIAHENVARPAMDPMHRLFENHRSQRQNMYEEV